MAKRLYCRPVPSQIIWAGPDEGEVGAVRYEITEHEPEVEVHIHQTGERTPQLMASLQDCQQGRCGCPTDQYDRLEDMTIHTDLDQLTIRLRPRTGQHLDTEQLQNCLDYTLEQAEQGAEP